MIIFTEDRFETIEDLINNIQSNDDPININSLKEEILFQIRTHKIQMEWDLE